MRRLFIPGLIALLLLPLAASPGDEIRLDLKLRVYEGSRQGSLTPPPLVTTSYIRPTISANMQMQAGFDLEKEKEQIKRVFNLQDVGLLTEADLVIGEERAGRSSSSARHFFRLNGNAFSIIVMLIEWKNPGRFLVLLNDVTAEKPENVLTTEMLLHGGHSAVFGFEDKKGKPYFFSFHITGPPDKIMPPPPPPPPAPPVPPEVREKIEEFEKGAVKASDAVNPPRLLKKVDPAYPPGARQSGLKGYVVLNVRTDGQGNVKDVMVIRSTGDVFNEPAMAAVKQWKYEPYREGGQPKELVFSVSLRFESQ
jgi:TonB family protein